MSGSTTQLGSSSALHVRGLSVSATPSGVPIVADVSFRIEPGRVMGLVGESGCGKSTVALALLGHARRGLRISSGRVQLGDVDILQLSPSDLRQVRGRFASYVPQDPASSLNPAIRVGEQLREALIVHRQALDGVASISERVSQILEEVNLPATRKMLRSYPHQLSGGQQQRIVIGMAFACRPRLIVLDEPTTGLDVTTQRHILDTIRAMTRTYGATAVYVSHDLPVVAQVADDTAVMYAGRVVEYAPTRELFGAPRHPYTLGLVSAAPSGDRATTLVGIPGHPPRPGAWPQGCSFADRCSGVQSECTAKIPELEVAGTGRQVRCFFPLAGEPDAGAGLTEIAESQWSAGATVAVSGLVAKYGPVEVLHGVDLTVAPGRCIAVVGESGSGKTTLAQCIIGLNSSWTGSVTLDGVTLAPSARRRTNDQRRRVQYIFQNPYGSLNPRQSVAENIEEPLRHFERQPWSARRQHVLEILDVVALGRVFADKMPDQLSGGERQRVAIARALVVGPEVLVCDEVTSALDVSVQALLVEQLRQLQQERGLTMIFITHNLAIVRSIAQDVVVLQDGSVVEQGRVSSILDHPGHAYTQQLLRDVPRWQTSTYGTRIEAPIGGQL